MNIKGTKTEKNILTAFMGESQARNKYTYFASVARKEGYVQIADIFEETANQEKEHAKRLFKYLEGGDLQVTEKTMNGPVCIRNTPKSRVKKVFLMSPL
jgi:rubrerythrin